MNGMKVRHAFRKGADGWYAEIPHTAIAGTHVGQLEIMDNDGRMSRATQSFLSSPVLPTLSNPPRVAVTSEKGAGQSTDVVIEYTEDAGCQSSNSLPSLSVLFAVLLYMRRNRRKLASF